MVNTRSARIQSPQKAPKRPESKPAKAKGQALLVKKGKETMLCYIEEPLDPKSRSILVKKLSQSGQETCFKSQEELKINPKDIVKQIEVNKKGQIFSISKEDAKSIHKPNQEPKTLPKTKQAAKLSPSPKAKPQAKSPSESSESEPESSSSEDLPSKRKSPSKSKQSNSKPSKKLKLEVYKKGVSNPNVSLLKRTSDLEDESNVPRFGISVQSNNRNVHRAVETNNQSLFKALLKSSNKISSVFGYWSSSNQLTPLELALIKNNEYFIKEIFKEVKDNKIKKTHIPESGLKSVGTGFVSKQAYGVNVRQVNMSRGGREGNNAFLSDDVAQESYYSVKWQQIIHHCTPATINLLLTLIPNFENLSGSHIGSVIRSGNIELARHLLAIHTKTSSFGFNFLHLAVLKPGKLPDFKKVSITKKPIENFSVAPLHAACINPDPAHLKSLLAECDDIGYADLEGRRCVHYAAACTSKKPLELLQQSGANLNEMDRKKITPLMVAAMFNRAETAAFLIEKGVSPKIKSREGKGPIHYAAEKGCLDVLKVLVKFSDINQPGGDRKTPLMYAASLGHFKAVELLLENGAKVTSKDKCKRTALIWAVKNGYSQIASLLLLKGSPFNEPDSSKNHPIHYAAAFGWVECLELLISAGADLNAVNDWKMPALLIAMLKGQMGIVERLLQESSIDVNCKDESGRTLLSQSIEVLTEETLKQIKYFIEEKKADPNIADQEGWTPLHHLASKPKPVSSNRNFKWAERKNWEEAAWEMQVRAVGILIEGGADLNKENSSQNTPIMLACRTRNSRIVKALLDAGADIGEYKGFETVLHHLSSFEPEFLEQAKRVLEKVVDKSEIINGVNDEGVSPLIAFVMHLSEVKQRKNKIYNFIKKNEVERINLLRKKQKMKLVDEEFEDEEFIDDCKEAVLLKKIAEDNKSSENEEDEDQNEEDEDENENENENEEDEDNQNSSEDRNSEENNSSKSKEEEEEDQNLDMDLDQTQNKNPDFNLNEQQIKAKTLETWSQNFESYFSVLKLLVSKGALVNQPVQKLKKYRENPKLAESEETPTNENFIKTPSGVKIYKEYSADGLKSVLHFMNLYYSPDLILFLLSQGADINLQDFYGNTPLNKFISSFPYIPLIALLLSNGADPNTQTIEKQRNALHLAANAKNEEITKLILKHNPNLNQQDSFGSTALSISSENRSAKVVRALCQAGADPNITDSKNRTSLHYAFRSATVSSNASFEVESLLLHSGASINAVDKHGRCPLHYAFLKKSNKKLDEIDPIETVSSACSKKGINVNIPDKFNRTPVHYAARRGALTSTMFLLSKGADIEVVDIDGNTPVALGIIGGHSNYVSMLLQRGVDIQKPLINKKTDKKNALNYNKKLQDCPYSYFRACVRLDWQGAAYLLLFSGYSYSLALQDALNEEKFELVLTLFAKIDDPAVFLNKNSEGQNLFHTLAVKGRQAGSEVASQIFQQLIDFQVKHDEPDVYGRTPLHYAAANLNSVLCSLLLERGVEINKLDKEGNSPLVKAVEGDLIKKNYEVIKQLSVYKADFCVKVPRKGYETSLLLHGIEENCEDRVLNLVLNSGCSVYQTDTLGRSALMMLIINNDYLRLKRFVKKYKFDLNQQDQLGRTVVHYAIWPFDGASYENKQVLTLLLDNNASAEIKDYSGTSPYYLASLQLSGRMKEALEKYNIKEELTVDRKYSGFLEDLQEINCKKDAEEYSESLNLVKQVEDDSEKPDPNGMFADYFKVVNDYDVYMNKVDITYGPYSAYNFYRMQLLRDTNRDVFVVFTRWGRIGEVGMFQRTPFASLEEAEKEFKNIFKNKSGNEWGSDFVRVKGKYTRIKFDRKREVNKDHIQEFNFDVAPDSRLDKSLLDIFKTFSRASIFRSMMENYQIDKNRLNLSNISSDLLDEAEELLREILKLVLKLAKTKENDFILRIKEEICDLSSQYFELIPGTGFQDNMIPPLLHDYRISQEVDKIYSFRNIEIASKMLLGALKNQKTVHPCDYIYQCLSTSMRPLEESSPEYKFIKQYFENGYSESMKIKKVFEVRRKGEKERIEKYAKIKNRKLLWHGSSACNFLGILKEGLRIMPLEGVSHGRSYGNGLYFADSARKSLSYAYQHYARGVAESYLLLCEVVLGKVQTNNDRTGEFKLKPGMNSFQAFGRTIPDPSKSVYLTSGAEVPLGSYIEYKRKKNETGLYFSVDNEYIVYSEDQVRIRYIVNLADEEKEVTE